MKQQFIQVAQKEEDRKTTHILNTVEGVTRPQALLGLQVCENNELVVIRRLVLDPSFHKSLVEILANGGTHKDLGSLKDPSILSGPPSTLPSCPTPLNPLSTKKKPRKGHFVTKSSSHRAGFNIDGSVRAEPLKLEDALARLRQKDVMFELEAAQGDEQEAIRCAQEASVMDTRKAKLQAPPTYKAEELKELGWSDARIKAFLGIKKNPYAFYYRFNAPGEKQDTGTWNKTSHEIFMKLISTGVDYNWGKFSMQVPGRVGYQCSNYYRKLVLNKTISDENYQIDEKGKLRFIRPKRMKSRHHTRKKRRGDTIYAREVDSSDEEASITQEGSVFGFATSSKTSILPDIKCPMTLEPLTEPALSPYGHVMNYDTWVRVLGKPPKNTCPFTKQKVTRRDLVKLTVANLDEYRGKIKNE